MVPDLIDFLIKFNHIAFNQRVKTGLKSSEYFFFNSNKDIIAFASSDL